LLIYEFTVAQTSSAADNCNICALLCAVPRMGSGVTMGPESFVDFGTI